MFQDTKPETRLGISSAVFRLRRYLQTRPTYSTPGAAVPRTHPLPCNSFLSHTFGLFESLPTIHTVPPCIRAYGSASNPTTLRTIGRGRATPYTTTTTAVQCTVPTYNIAQCRTRNIDTSVRPRRHRYPRTKKPHHLAMPRALGPTKSATMPSGKVSWAQTSPYSPTSDAVMDTTRPPRYNRWMTRTRRSGVRCGKARTRT
jgi:hypothetical protein